MRRVQNQENCKFQAINLFDLLSNQPLKNQLTYDSAGESLCKSHLESIGNFSQNG